jgi:hypothetical protein
MTAICSLVVGCFLGYWYHALSKRRDAEIRRREFRDEIRIIPLRFDNIHPMNFTKTYEESARIVKELSIKRIEDIRWWKRKRFIQQWNRYCGFKHSDLELPRPNNPAALEECLRANKKKREEVLALLCAIIEKIIRLAK